MSFWTELCSRKLDTYKLSDAPIDIQGKVWGRTLAPRGLGVGVGGLWGGQAGGAQ